MLYLSGVRRGSSPGWGIHSQGREDAFHWLHLPTCLHPVTCGFQRNLDVAGNRRSGGLEHVQLIAIDYHTVAGTAGAECKGD